MDIKTAYIITLFKVLIICLLTNAEYNLFGIPGQGYLIKVNLGIPPQEVIIFVLFYCI